MEVLQETSRALSPAERRYLAMARADFIKLRRKHIWIMVASFVFLMTLLIAGSSQFPHRNFLLTGAFAVGLTLYSVWQARNLFDSVNGEIKLSESAARANRVSEIRICAQAVVELKEDGVDTSSFAFQVEENAIALVSVGFETQRFPNDNFSVIKLLDERNEAAYTLIKSHGRKLPIMRSIPGDQVKDMKMPATEFSSFSGRLEDIENILRQAPPVQA